MQRVFTLFVFAALSGGCVAAEGDESFIIQGVLAPPATGDSCVFTPNTSGPFLSSGLMDFTIHNSYRVAAQFESRVTAAEGKESLRRIDVQGANITLTVSPILVTTNGSTAQIGTEQVIEFQTLFSTSIPPNLGISVGIFDAIPFDIVDRVIASAGAEANKFGTASAQAVAEIAPFGDFYGDRLEGATFRFPISLSNLGRNVLGTCPLEATIAVPEPSPCGFQDLVLPCCQNGDGTVTCPPTIATE
jgi:hypothetical protein